MSEVKILNHVSFDPIDKFVLRVPANRSQGEDETTPRICLSEYINYAITSMPQGGEALRGMLAFKKTVPILHLYMLVYNGQEGFKNPEMLKNKVLDAIYLREWWAVKIPEFEHRIIKVNDAILREGSGLYGTTGVYVDAIDYDIIKDLPDNAPELYFKQRDLNYPVRTIFKTMDDLWQKQMM